jgi:hypothetical protein
MKILGPDGNSAPRTAAVSTGCPSAGTTAPAATPALLVARPLVILAEPDFEKGQEQGSPKPERDESDRQQLADQSAR